MNAEDMNELKELIEFLKENKIGEFDLERGDLKVRIKFAQEGGTDLAGLARLLQAQAAAAPASVIPSGLGSGCRDPRRARDRLLLKPRPLKTATRACISSNRPLSERFTSRRRPGSAAFVKIGDQVDVGQVLCIVEAMKLMNEIESDAAGEVVKRFVQSGQPVEYGQQLFAVRPR